MQRLITVSMLLLLGLALGACRGGISEKPPVHLVLDMDFQQKIKAQSKFEFEGWDDHRGMRLPVAGTVAQGQLADQGLRKFQDQAGNFIDNPLPPTLANFERGRQRFDIYCAVCHDRAGAGKGIVLQRAGNAFNPLVPNLAAEPRLRDMKDGELFQTITNGRATMPAYGHMVTPEDRWCIVHYLRALQNRIITE